jgi:hypothetical protein
MEETEDFFDLLLGVPLDRPEKLRIPLVEDRLEPGPRHPFSLLALHDRHGL